jgi:hypothetical protein
MLPAFGIRHAESRFFPTTRRHQTVHGSNLQFPLGVGAGSASTRASQLVAETTTSPSKEMTAEQTERLKLRDGRAVDVRPLERRDRRLLAAAITRLSDHSRYLRFASPKRGMTDRDHLGEVDHRDHEALLAIDPLTGQGVAVARYIQVPGEPSVVELAATVADGRQGWVAPCSAGSCDAPSSCSLVARYSVRASRSREGCVSAYSRWRSQAAASSRSSAARYAR